MNERIKDLADQASDHADTQVNTNECDSCGECEHCIDWYDVYNSKFAELIVRECMDQCEDMDDRYRIGIHFSI
jgi:hypothetical protein